MTQSITLHELHAVYETSEIAWSGEGEPFRFRIEVFRNISKVPTKFYGRIYRREHFRIQPTFPQIGGEPKLPSYDKLISVEDEFLIDWDSSESDSPDECLRRVCTRIEEVLGVRILAGSC